MSEVVPFTKLFERVNGLYQSGGLPRGDRTGWPCVDDLYTVLPGQWTVVTGIPQAGKSEWLDAMLMNLAETDEWEFALYSPENHPVETHVVKLCEKRVRKPFNPGPTERMTDAESRAAQFWVYERFFWLNPQRPDPEYLLDLAASRAGKKKLGIVLDPWNTLDHQRGGLSETDYISVVLTQVTRIARTTNAHIWLVVHPAKIQKDRNGERPVPTPYDISGSAHWYNKADNIITVHRRQAEKTQEVEIHVQKVRFKHVGHIGMATLLYDKVTGVYFERPSMISIRGEQYRAPPREPGQDDEEQAA